MNKTLQTFLSCTLLMLIGYFGSVGVYETVNHYTQPPTQSVFVYEQDKTSAEPSPEHPEPSEAAEFISGPLTADVGQLCVFRLNDPETQADWVIVPEADCYIDSSGSSLAFASNVPARYTIIAAVVEENAPKILTHICEYGLQPEPQPDPGPTPNPDPTPKPNPPPVVTLKDWVTQNVPEAAKNKAAALASCYESAADGIETGSIRSQEAAFSVIRTATQTKIDIAIWAEFLDALSVKLTEKLAGNTDVKTMGTLFREIADGLKAVSGSDITSKPSTTETPILSEALQIPAIIPATNDIASPGVCSDPTGKACQPQPRIPYRRSK